MTENRGQRTEEREQRTEDLTRFHFSDRLHGNTAPPPVPGGGRPRRPVRGEAGGPHL